MDMGSLLSKSRPVLVKAVELDQRGESEEASKLYTQGIEYLFEARGGPRVCE